MPSAPPVNFPLVTVNKSAVVQDANIDLAYLPGSDLLSFAGGSVVTVTQSYLRTLRFICALMGNRESTICNYTGPTSHSEATAYAHLRSAPRPSTLEE